MRFGIFRPEKSIPPSPSLRRCVVAAIPATSLIATGSHVRADWDPSLTASEEPLLDGAERYEGPEVALTDNRAYCAFARFCDAKGQVWNLVSMEGKQARDLTVREADHCPAGRLSAWTGGQEPHEPHFEPSLGLIEDPQQGSSGPLWVRGGIPFSREDGFTYEVRNRVTLCRCGRSSNKPFCDGSHASIRFQDGLPSRPDPRRRTLVAGTRETGAHGNEENFPCAFL